MASAPLAALSRRGRESVSTSGAHVRWDEVRERCFELLLALLDGRRGALFLIVRDDLELVTSDRLDQGAIDVARSIWPSRSRALRAGSPVNGSGPRPHLVLPCMDAAELRGLVYLETNGCRLLTLAQLATFSLVLGRALTAWLTSHGCVQADSDSGPQTESPELDLLLQARVGFDGTTPTAAMLRLLERNEWNVARVARMIGVTRATVYNRLRRAGAVRKRLRVSPRRRSRPETAVGAEKEPEGRQPTNPSASLGVADAPVLHGTTCGAPIPLKEQPPCDQDPAK